MTLPNTATNMSNTVPAFLTKLWTLVENPMVDDLICWDENGNSFHVYDQGRFAKEILPHYFKHSNIASFIRQLNMYGFRKVSHIEHGLKDESDDLEFQHMYFRRGQEHLLEKIKRKIAGSSAQFKVEPFQEIPAEGLNKVITDIQVMKEKQETVNTKLQSMKRENELLWREVASLRQKHAKQQQIVNKLIQFLIHLVGGRSGLGVNLNRKRPLMLSDSSQVSVPPAKIKKYVKADTVYSVQSPDPAQSGEGPVISELPDHDVYLDNKPTVLPPDYKQENTTLTKPAVETIPNKMDASTSDWKLPSDFLTGDILDMQEFKDLKDLPTDLNTPSPTIIPPFSDVSGLDNNFLSSITPVTAPSGNTQDKNSTSLQQKVKTPKFGRQQSVHELNDHLESVQYDLDGLRDILSSSQYSIDPSFLLGVINILDPDSIKSDDEDVNKLNSSGSELVQYKPLEVLPDLFDLANLTKEDEDSFSPAVDIGELYKKYDNEDHHVLEDDLD